MRAFASSNFSLTSRIGLWIACLSCIVILFAVSAQAQAAHDDHAAAGAVESAAAEHDVGDSGIPLAAPHIFHVGPLPVTNSMVLCWVIAIGITVWVQLAMRKVRDVPHGGQNFWEWIIESLHDFLETIVGPELVKKTFWFFATIFIVILFTNWFGLIPGVGSIGWGHPDAAGHVEHITRPIFRGANADLNMTLAMAMVFFACWIVWAIQANGVGGFILHIFGPKGDTTGFMKVLMIVVFIGVGLLEVVTILFRPVTLSFRLFGNIFAGENLLEAMAMISPHFGWLIALPFYFMELLVGLVQALVFMLLTAVFTVLITQHEEGHSSGHSAQH